MDHRRRRLGERIVAQIGLALMVLATALIQTNLLPTILRAPLNLVLVAAVACTILAGVDKGAAVAFYGGLFLDMQAGTPLGDHALALLIGVVIAAAAMERFPGGNWVLPLLLVALVTPLYHAIVIVLSGGTNDWLSWVLIVIPPAVFVNMALALPEYMVVQWWHDRKIIRDQ